MEENCAICLVCPITYSLFHDPVIAEDGHTYERFAIINWIQRNDTSPLTREPITIAGLRPNHLIRKLIDEFKHVLSKHNYKFKLGVDIERSPKPFFQTTGKSLFEAKWLNNPNGPPIALLKLFGARAEQEASFYEYLTRHQNIVYTYGLVEHPQQQSNVDFNTSVMLLQEMASEGNLQNLLENRSETHPNNPFSDILLIEIFLQITDAMIFLSEKGIIHGDLACRNILVFHIDEKEPKRTLVKLTDFGISRGNTIYSKIDAVTTVIDTVPIRSSAPEVLQNIDNNKINVYSEKSDMYAMGVFMWETYSNGKIPWGIIKKESEVREKVINGERLSRPDNCKLDHLWALMLKCMSQKPDDRPTFVELKKQLTEPINPVINSNILLNSSQSNSSVESLTTIKQEIVLDKTSETLRSSINSDDCHETKETSLSSIGVNVKSRLSFFEEKIEEQKQLPSHYRSKTNIHSKISSKSSSPKTTPPQEELIKLTKWHSD